MNASLRNVFWLHYEGQGLEISRTGPIRLADVSVLIRHHRRQAGLPAPLLAGFLDRLAKAAAAMDTRTPIDLWLPFFDRKEWRAMPESLASTGFYPVAPGTLLGSMTEPGAPLHRRGYAESVLTVGCAAALRRGPNLPAPPLRLRVVVPGSELHGPVANPAAHHAPSVSSRPEQASALAVDLSLPGEFTAAWLDAPLQKTTEFFVTWKRIAARVQRSLRAWLRWMWCSNYELFRDFLASRAAVMYWLSPLFSTHARSQFTYDPCAPGSAAALCRVGAQRFEAELAAVQSALTAAGMAEQARPYSALSAREIMAAVREDRNRLKTMMAIETEVIDTLINFSLATRTLRSHPQPVKRMADVACDFMRRMRAVLRRFPVPGFSHDLAIVILIEATASLRDALGLPEGVQAELHAQSGERNESPLPLAC